MTRSIAVALFACAALGGAISAEAQAPTPVSSNLSAAFVACYQRAGQNVVQRGLCASREDGAQDDRLNKAYQQVMRQLASDPAARLKLRDDERRWIHERDYSCKINGDTVDDSCVVMKTATRADELESRVRF